MTKPTKKSKTTDKLTLRERKLIKGLAEGLQPTEAARRAGYAESTIKAQLKRTVGNSRVQQSIQELMETKGLTQEKLLEVLGDGLQADKVISCNVIAANGEGMKDANSMTKDFVDVPDHAIRHKYLETGLKLGKHFPDTKLEVTGKDGAPLGVLVLPEIDKVEEDDDEG